MRFIKVVTIVCLLNLSLGCVKIKPKGSTEDSSSRPTAKTNLLEQENPIYDWIESDVPNQYQLKIKKLETANVVVKRLLHASDSSNSEFLFFDQDFVIDSNLKSGLNYLFQIGKLTDSGFELFSEFEVQVPQDLVVENEWVLKEPIDAIFNRIYFLKNAKIKIQDKNLNLRAKILYSEGALIYAYAENDVAPTGIIGKSAGSVHISIDQAKGELKLDLRGEKGGVGKAGEPWVPLQAASGANSEGDKYIKQSSPSVVWVCDFKGNAPKNGSSGKKGKTGGQGAKSGDSGNLFLDVEQDNGFFYSIFESARLGGSGGAGGAGQIGGLAGKTMAPINLKNVTLELCKHSAANKGEDGSVGDQGETGAVGVKGLTCIKIDRQPRRCF